MSRFTDLLLSQLHNQFVGGALVVMFTGSAIALLRAVPRHLWEWLKRRATIEVEIINSDPLFDYVTVWLDAQPYSKRSRKLSATTRVRVQCSEDENEAPKKLNVYVSPAPGIHVFMHGSNFLWLERQRGNPISQSAVRSMSPLERESYSITILGKDQTAIRSLIEEIIEFGSKPSDSIRLFNSNFGYWKANGVLFPRRLDSVVLPEGVVEYLLNDVRKFLESSLWYRSLGIPWHRGYLLHGIPGSGKTSLVSALAGELGMDLYLLNIGGSGMDDARLSSLMSEVRSGTIVLMEDVDCTFPNRESNQDNQKVTLAGLLNCLDGVQSREGCMIFMTTNFKDRLDSALTRPGRVDVALEFGLATEEQIIRLKDRLVPGVSDENALALYGKSMAEAQGALLREADMIEGGALRTISRTIMSTCS